MNIPDPVLHDIIEDSALHAELIQGVELQPYMKEVFRAIDKHRKVLIFTPHAVGKTHGMGALVTKYVTMHPGSKIITTAPTHRQVEDLLWREIAARHNGLPPEFRFGKLTNTKLDINDETFAKGFSVQKKVVSGLGQGGNSALQGYHAKHRVVALLDECIGIEPVVWGMVDGILSNARDKLIGIGNPTTRNCEAYRRSKQLGYHVIFITCFDTPNFIANGIICLEDMLEEKRILESLSQEEALERLNGYKVVNHHVLTVQFGMELLLDKGPEHPDFHSKVLGKFPDEDATVLIPESVVRESMEDSYEIDNQDERYIGVDVARYGTDSTVFTEIIGWQHTRTHVINGSDTFEVVKAFLEFLKESEYHVLDGDEWPNLRKTRIAIDPGYNPGVYDALRAIIEPWRYPEQADMFKEVIERFEGDLRESIIFDVPFGSSDFSKYYFGWADDFALHEKTYEEDRAVEQDRAHYQNIKAKMFDQLATDLKGYGLGKFLANKKEGEKDRGRLCLNPAYPKYLEQLPTIMMVHSKNDSKMMIESKKEYKDRTGQGSPDEADSLALANLARYYAIPLGGWD